MKDPAATDVRRGWCRVMGITAITVFLAVAFVVRNQRVLDLRRPPGRRRPAVAAGKPPNTRKRRRHTLADLAAPP